MSDPEELIVEYKEPPIDNEPNKVEQIIETIIRTLHTKSEMEDAWYIGL